MSEPISFLDKDILIKGVSTQLVAGTLKASGLAEREIGEILGWWYVGAAGGSNPPPFDFSTDVQATDPADEVTYVRSFAHTDWVDGEDRVQAGATPEELGFNARFHAIENEFDAIRDQFVRLAGGVTELRSDLVGVIRELEATITSLQNDLHDLRSRVDRAGTSTGPRGLGVLGTVKVGDKSAYIARSGDSFQLLEFAGSTLGETAALPPEVVNPAAVFDPVHARPDDVVRTVAGLEDLVSAPSVREVVDRPGATVADLRSAVGGAVLPSGVTAASVLAALPADQQLTGVAGTVSMLTDHVVGLLPAPTADAVLKQALGDAGGGAAPADLGAASAEVVGLSPGIVGALNGVGVDTSVNGLAQLSTASLVQKLSGADVNVSSDALRDAVTRTRILGAFAHH